MSAVAVDMTGVHQMSASKYHNDPVEGGSLNSSGARTILRSPAHYRHQLAHPKQATEDMMFGTIVHSLVLGTDEPITIIDAENYQGKVAKAAKAAALAAGEIPILARKYAVAEEMAAVVLDHPEAGPLLTEGEPEQTLIWRDHGIWRRARIDSLHPGGAVDYKTTNSCDLADLARTMFNFKYHQQDPWYRDAIRGVGMDRNPWFKFVFQEKEPPYAVRIVELHAEDVALGEAENVRAMAIYRDCRALDDWPGYPTHTAVVTLPAYAHNSPESPSCL